MLSMQLQFNKKQEQRNMRKEAEAEVCVYYTPPPLYSHCNWQASMQKYDFF